MTTIVIRKDSQNNYRGFYCMGHAGYAKKRLFAKSEDILCAAISVTVLNTVNSLTELAGEKLKIVENESTGFLKCDILEDLQERSVFLLDSMVFGLQNLQKEYGDQFLQVNFEEV